MLLLEATQKCGVDDLSNDKKSLLHLVLEANESMDDTPINVIESLIVKIPGCAQ